jgi:hypothetical protein
MKKGVKITLIVVSTVVIILGSFGGTLWYSAKNVGYNVEDPTITGFISKVTILPPTYEGFIIVDVPLDISNGGFYDACEIVIIIDVYGQNFNDLSTLNEKLLGHGTNPIGNIAHGTDWSGTLELNMTTSISLLAIWNGELRIEIEISLKVDFLVYKAPITFNETQIEPWDAPFIP